MFYGIVDDGAFTAHRIVNLLNDGPFKGLENYQWWCSQTSDSEYVDERLDMYSQIEITSSDINKIEKKAELTFKVPLGKGYFKIPKDGIY